MPNIEDRISFSKKHFNCDFHDLLIKYKLRIQRFKVNPPPAAPKATKVRHSGLSMKSILVVSKEERAYSLVLSAFRSNDVVEKTDEHTAALELFHNKRFDLIFIDLNALNNHGSSDNYREVLMPFWQLYPSLEIIVMAPQEKIREAVKAVKAGANDYLTYPLDAEELKLVSDTINKTHLEDISLDEMEHIN